MTWGFSDQDIDNNVSWFSCWAGDDCNAYTGDTLCTETMPVLCVNDVGADDPGYGNTGAGWVGGDVALSAIVSGCLLTPGQTAGDTICAEQFGEGWRMLEHHDGGGFDGRGYGLLGPGEVPDRFWTAIDNQPANCWNSI